MLLFYFGEFMSKISKAVGVLVASPCADKYIAVTCCFEFFCTDGAAAYRRERQSGSYSRNALGWYVENA